MIFVTVGTHGQPFERILKEVERLPNPDEVVLQYGVGSPPRAIRRAAAFMSFGEMEEYFQAADVIVTHAGVGSILCARRAGRRPIVVPRYRDLGEHVDDHQVELTRALAERGEVEPVWRDDDLVEAVERGSPAVRVDETGVSAQALVEAVRTALLGPRQVPRPEKSLGR